MSKRTIVTMGVATLIAVSTVASVRIDASATAIFPLQPRYGAVSVEQQDPTYQYRAMPALQYVGWKDSKGVSHKRFIRSFLISADGQTPVRNRLQYQDSAGRWQQALDAVTRKPLLYSTNVGGGTASLNNVFTMAAGTVVSIDTRANVDSRGRFVYRRTSVDGGASWRSTKAYINMAGEAVLGGAVGQAFQRVVRLPDGSLMMPFYVHHAGRRMASYILTSTDGGQSWKRSATVFKSSVYDYNESAVARRADGRLMMISRFDVNSGGKHYSKLIGRFTNGRVDSAAALATASWGKAFYVKVPGATDTDVVRGVAPILNTMDRGVLMLTFGRPRNKITFSYNDGNTWSTARNLYDNIPTKGCTKGRPVGNNIYVPCSDLGSSGYMGVAITSSRTAYIMGDNCQSWGCDGNYTYPHGRDDKMWLTTVRLE